MQAAAAKAQEISENALEAGASAVCDVLGKGKCRFSANLMVPVPLRGSSGPGYVPNSVAESNSRKASELWNHSMVSNICLLIVAETKGSSHSGFWVPLMRGEDDADLPGAAAAYYRMEANGVFKDDLPPLTGFQKHLGSK